jgi:hypothetical protein
MSLNASILCAPFFPDDGTSFPFLYFLALLENEERERERERE